MVIGTLLRTLAPRAASAVGVRVVSAALNHLLTQHPNARRRLATHQSKRICIGLDTDLPPVLGSFVPQPQAWFEITAGGELRTATSGVADAQLLIKPSFQAASDMATGGTENLARHLRVEGDVMLAGLLGELVQDLTWDYEDDLSRVIGDIPARRVGEAVKRVAEMTPLGRRRTESALSPAAEPDSSAASTLLNRRDFDLLNDEIAELNRRIQNIKTNAVKKN